MAFLKPGVPLATREPFLRVENELPVGKYLFQLVVVDDDGQRSDPMQVVVVVTEQTTRTVFDRSTVFVPVTAPTSTTIRTSPLLRPRIP